MAEPLAVVSRLVLRPSILDKLKPTDGHVSVHRIAGYWVTVGDPDRYLTALRAYAEFQTQPSKPSTRENL